MPSSPFPSQALVAVLLLITCFVPYSHSAPQYNCDRPCPKAYKPVCGADDIEYQNECFAVCQGVIVSTGFSCLDFTDDQGAPIRKRGRPDRSSFDTDGGVDKATMERFKGEGFRYVGQQKSGKGSKPNVKDGTPVQLQLTQEEIDKHPLPHHRAVRATRMTDEGHIYEEVIDENEANLMLKMLTEQGSGRTASFQGRVPPSEVETNATSRKLKYDTNIIGVDDRFRMTGTGWPDAPLSHIMMDIGGAKRGSCSGVFIDMQAVLTAGHCVSDGAGTLFTDFWVFPAHDCARNEGQACADPIEPYGSVTWRTVTTFSGWHNGKDLNWDLAIITVNRPPGCGHFGIAYSCGSVTRTLSSVGWPVDKPDYTRWGQVHTVTNDQCKSPFDQCVDVDGTSGQSGSGMWDSDVAEQETVRYVLNAVAPGSACNWAVAIGPQNWKSLLAWKAYT